MESIIYNKFLGQCLWTLCLKTMRGTGIGMVSMSPIMNPQSRGATSFRTITPTILRKFSIFLQSRVKRPDFFSDFFLLVHMNFQPVNILAKITLQHPNFFGYLFYCHYFVYSNSTIIIKLTKPKTSYSLISKLSEVFEVTFFRISSKTLRRNGLYLFGLNTKQSLCSL